MRLRHLYLVLCILGILLPYSQFTPWFVEHGVDFPLFFRQLFANRISAFFGMDVIVSSLVLWLLVFSERNRLGIKRLSLPVLASLAVGVSLGLPLFLYMRQVHLNRTALQPTAGPHDDSN